MADLLSRLSEGLYLPPSVSGEIWEKAQEGSIFMKLASRMDLPPLGTTVSIMGDDGAAEWVEEGEDKPVSTVTVTNKRIAPYKAARILVFTDEYRRDVSALYAAIVRRAPNALYKLFDSTVAGNHTVPGPYFDTFASSPTQALGNPATYANLLATLTTLSANDGGLSAWAMSLQGQIAMLSAVDSTGRPLLTQAGGVIGGIGSVGTVLGAPVVSAKTLYNNPSSGPDVVGIAGDFAEDARYGVAEDIFIKYNDTGSVTDSNGVTHNFFSQNKFGILIEATYGFAHKGANKFVKLTGATTA